MEQDQGASAKADRAATPSEPSQSSVVSGVAGIPCAFTRGPWTLREVDDLDIAHAVDRDGVPPTPIADIYGASAMQVPKAEADANARLIAAAPELYEALRQLRSNAEIAKQYLPETELAQIVSSALFDTISQADQVLAKARGQ